MNFFQDFFQNKSEEINMLSVLATPQTMGQHDLAGGRPGKMMDLCSSVHIENIDMMGNKSILNRIAPGQVFGETYTCIPGKKLLIEFDGCKRIAESLFSGGGKIFTCPDTCPCHETDS